MDFGLGKVVASEIFDKVASLYQDHRPSGPNEKSKAPQKNYTNGDPTTSLNGVIQVIKVDDPPSNKPPPGFIKVTFNSGETKVMKYADFINDKYGIDPPEIDGNVEPSQIPAAVAKAKAQGVKDRMAYVRSVMTGQNPPEFTSHMDRPSDGQRPSGGPIKPLYPSVVKHQTPPF